MSSRKPYRILAGPGLAIALIAPTAIVADEGGTPSQLAGLLGTDADAGFERALAPREFEFPQDHGPHPAFRNEWWYVTGNLDDDDGRRFGYELTFFRFSLSPTAPRSDSAWHTNQVYIAHLAVTDAARDVFRFAQRYSRGAVGLAGARTEPFEVWIDDWQMHGTDNGGWRLRASDPGIGIDVALTALRPPVLNGKDGLSQKSADPGNASYYYSMTRLATQGTIRIDGREHAVAGLSWLDREWSSSALAPDQQGWDWFALQLSDGSDLMFYRLRKRDGSSDRHSAGTWVDPGNRSTRLRADDVSIEVGRSWNSPFGGSYPARWILRIPKLGLELEVEPVVDDQELETTVRYWEGAVDVRGMQNGVPVTGRGYVELTGYAQ